MARKAAAMPDAVARNRRRVMPWRFASAPPSSLSRASTRRWRAVCAAGMNSSLDTLCVGIGPAKAWVSAGNRLASSRSLSSPMTASSGGVAGARGHFQKCTHDVPELVAGVAQRDRMRGAGQHDELSIGVGQPTVEVEEVLFGRDAVVLAAHEQHG